MDEYLKFARDLAKKSKSIILDNFESPDLVVRYKEDSTPLTNVDTEINDLVINAVREKYPNHGVLSEEGDYGNPESEFVWICDPLDGTKSYIVGVKNSMFMLALKHQNEMVVSVVYDPFEDEMYQAIKGQGAYLNGKRIQVSNDGVNKAFVMIGDTPDSVVQRLKNSGSQVISASGMAYKCMKVARGQADAFVKTGGDFYDLAPAMLIVEEAGGRVTDFAGNHYGPTDKITGLIVSNPVCYDSLLQNLG